MLCSKVMNYEVVVDVANLDSGLTSQRVFTRTPIWIGSDPINDLHLPGTEVGSRQGDIVVERGGTLRYWDYDADARAHVNGAKAPRGKAVELSRPGVIILGRYALRARLQVPVVVSDAPALAERVQLASAMDAPGPALGRPVASSLTLARLETIASRAFDLATTLATLLVKIRGHLVFPMTSPVLQRADVSEIVEYLLDPSNPDARLDELARLVVAIVEWREFAGHASPLARA